MYLLCNIRHSILEKPKSKLEQKFRHTSSIALYYTNLLSRYKELLPKITANLVVNFLTILSIKDFQEIEVYFNYTTILENTAKESLSNHDPTERERFYNRDMAYYKWAEEMASLPLQSQNKNRHVCIFNF